jgi:guanylate kinase
MRKAMKPSEVDRKYYYFITKEEFLMMNEREELLKYALLCLWGV